MPNPIKALLQLFSRLAIQRPKLVILTSVVSCLFLGSLGLDAGVDMSLTAIIDVEHPSHSEYFDLDKELNISGQMPLLLRGDDDSLDEAAATMAAELSEMDSIQEVFHPAPVDWFENNSPWLVERELFDDWLSSATTLGGGEAATALATKREELESLASTELNRFEDHRLLMVQMQDSPWEVPMGEGHFVMVENRANEIASELGITAEFSGIVAISSQDQGKTLGRIRILTPLSLLLVLFILSRIEPRASYLLAVAAPMILTFVATLGVVGKATGTITILESIFGIMIFGLGVDFALHLLSRLREEQDGGADFETALTTSITQTGQGVVAGGMTTAGAFLIISLAPDIQATHLGLSGGIGLVICLTLMISMLPATWVLLQKNSKRVVPKQMALGWIESVAKLSERHYKKTILLGLAFFIFCAAGLQKHHFESDFEKIVNREIPAAVTGQYIGELYGLSKSPWMVATDSLAEAREVTDAFEQSIDFERVDSIAHLILEDLDERVLLLAEAAPTISRLRRSYSSMLAFAPPDRAGQLNEAIRSLRILEVAAGQPPPSPDNLPRALAGQLITPSGQFLVMSYTENLGMDGIIAGEERLIAQALDDRAVGFGMALETLVIGPNKWLIKTLWGIMAFMIALLFTDQRSIKWMLIALIPVVFGATATLGIMCWAERSFSSVMSLGVLLILGLGVDDGIHIVHRIREDRSKLPSQAAFRVGRAIFMTTLTTCASFAVLLFTDHVGMESMALVLILGLPVCLFASISLIPATVTLMDRFSTKHSN